MPLALNIDSNISYYEENQANEAMKRFWLAKQDGQQAELKRIDRIPEPPDDEPDPTPAGVVSDIAVERVRRHEQALLDRGIALPPPIYAPGTKVVQLGLDNFRTSRKAWEDLPETVAGLRGVYEAVQAEERVDFTVRVRDLRMLDDGTLDFGEGPITWRTRVSGRWSAATQRYSPGAVSSSRPSTPTSAARS